MSAIYNRIASIEAKLKILQELLHGGSTAVTVNEINEMTVEYFENKLVSEVEA